MCENSLFIRTIFKNETTPPSSFPTYPRLPNFINSEMDDFIMSNDKKRKAEDNICSLSKRVKEQEEILHKYKKELLDAKNELQRKNDLKDFFETVSSSQCMICNEPILGCIGTRSMGLTSYDCECSKARMIHLGCFTYDFKCVCGVQASIKTKSSVGKNVKVTVVEVEEEKDESDGNITESDLETEFEFGFDYRD